MQSVPPSEPWWPQIRGPVLFSNTLWSIDFQNALHINSVTHARVYDVEYMGDPAPAELLTPENDGTPYQFQLVGYKPPRQPYSRTGKYVAKLIPVAVENITTHQIVHLMNGDPERMFQRERIAVNALRILGLGRYGAIPCHMFSWTFVDMDYKPWAMVYNVMIMERFEMTMDEVFFKLKDHPDVSDVLKVAKVLGKKVSAAIEKINSHGILHRDTKLDNVVLIPNQDMRGVPFHQAVLFADVRLIDWNTAIVYNPETRTTFALDALYDFRNQHSIHTKVDIAMFSWVLAHQFAMNTKMGPACDPYMFDLLPRQLMAYFIATTARSSMWAYYETDLGKRWIRQAWGMVPDAHELANTIHSHRSLRDSHGPDDVVDIS